MSRDPESIQREIEQTRDALAGTLDQLADRYNPKAVASRGQAAAVARLRSPAGIAATGVTAGLVVLLVVRRIRKARRRS
jgi:type VI protein secretion system component VasF